MFTNERYYRILDHIVLWLYRISVQSYLCLTYHVRLIKISFPANWLSGWPTFYCQASLILQSFNHFPSPSLYLSFFSILSHTPSLLDWIKGAYCLLKITLKPIPGNNQYWTMNTVSCSWKLQEQVLVVNVDEEDIIQTIGVPYLFIYWLIVGICSIVSTYSISRQ